MVWTCDRRPAVDCIWDRIHTELTAADVAGLIDWSLPGGANLYARQHATNTRRLEGGWSEF